MFGIQLEETDPLVTGLVIYAGVVLLFVWLAMILWTYRDMRARSRDTLALVFVVVVVAVLTLPGLIIYFFLRPRETLAEAYERSLEEEALLQEIEEKPTCPGCNQRVQAAWQVCPGCHTRLKKACVACRSLLELSWGICPYCTTPQPRMQQDSGVSYSQQTAPVPEQVISLTRRDSAPRDQFPAGDIQFVDGDEF